MKALILTILNISAWLATFALPISIGALILGLIPIGEFWRAIAMCALIIVTHMAAEAGANPKRK